MERLCGETIEAIWLPRGRLAKYSSDTSGETCDTSPSTRTWRSSSRQWKTTAACPFVASSRPLRLS